MKTLHATLIASLMSVMTVGAFAADAAAPAASAAAPMATASGPAKAMKEHKKVHTDKKPTTMKHHEAKPAPAAPAASK